MLSYLSIVLKVLVKSEKNPDAVIMGMLKARIINMPGRSIKNAEEPERMAKYYE